jgi:arylformamidase
MPKTTANDNKGTGSAKSGWIDITIPIHDKMLSYPTDPFPPEVRRIKDVDRGDRVTLSEWHFVSHTGTHIDAPLHFVPHGSTIDKMPLDVAIGPARVIESKDPECIRPEELKPYNIKRGERLLFKTKNSEKIVRSDVFTTKYVYLRLDAAQYLADIGIALIGWDYLTLGKHETEADYPSTADYLTKGVMHRTHRAFLDKGIYIMETIDLSGVKPGNYELFCLPLKMVDGDAGLTRAVIRPI